MSKESKSQSMTEALRDALSKAESLRAIDRATGVKHPSMIKFLRGDQSLRLDMADKLAAYFGIKIVTPKRTKKD